MLEMMVWSYGGVEYSAKIAMSALRGGAAAMALLRDRDRPRCIFLGFRAREFVNQTLGIRSHVLRERTEFARSSRCGNIATVDQRRGGRFVAAMPTAADDLFSKSRPERQKSAQTDAPEG